MAAEKIIYLVHPAINHKGELDLGLLGHGNFSEEEKEVVAKAVEETILKLGYKFDHLATDVMG